VRLASTNQIQNTWNPRNWDTISVPLDMIRVSRPTDIFRVEGENG